MKKLLCIALCVVMLLAAASCTPEKGTEEKIHDAYTFSKDNTAIAINDNAAPVLAAFGEWIGYSESVSCYFTGKDKIYTYAGVEIFTYPDGEKDRVYMIRLYDDTVETEEGIRIGASSGAVKEIYGKPTKEGSAALIYRAKGMYLVFFLEDGSVAEIQYQHPDFQEK